MTAFHRQVAAGRSVAEALSSAQERIRGDGDARTEAAVAGFVWPAYTGFGDHGWGTMRM